MKIVNNTHYYSINNKTYNIVPDNDSWQFQSSKRMAYSQRLYWEYKYIKSVGGQAFFYTFTYNNKSMPYYEYDLEVWSDKTKEYELVHHRHPCFNYEHIRLLTNGIISKTLRRKYGSQLRYFVACERGEGKGFRGKGMNPHYHVIFFISPLPDKFRKKSDVPYKRISPIQFCHLCKCVWQYQSTPNKYDHLVADYKSARFGHCQPGDDCGLITDFDALSYVSKYVCKDSLQTYDDLNVKESFLLKFKKLGLTYHSLYSYYLHLRSTGSILDRKHFFEYSHLDKFLEWRSLTGRRDVAWWRFLQLQYPLDELHFYDSYVEFHKNIYLPYVTNQAYRDYVNMYGSKVRCSKSLGIYGMNFIKDDSINPHFVLNKSDEVITQPISLYYYRKQYMNVVRCPHSGNNLYVLNDAGIQLKCYLLKSNLEKVKRQCYESLDFISSNFSNQDIISDFARSNLKFLDFCNLYKRSDLDSILERFSVYRFIYQYRHYSKFSLDEQPFISAGFEFGNYMLDYRSFLYSNYYTCDYTEMKLQTLIEYHSSAYVVSFRYHPEFQNFVEWFDLIEAYIDIYVDYMSSVKKKKFEQSTELLQKINSVKYSIVNSSQV